MAVDDCGALLAEVLNDTKKDKLDLFNEPQQAFVIRVCRESAMLCDAGRKLFGATRVDRKSVKDARRLRKHLVRFDLDW